VSSRQKNRLPSSICCVGVGMGLLVCYLCFVRMVWSVMLLSLTLSDACEASFVHSWSRIGLFSVFGFVETWGEQCENPPLLAIFTSPSSHISRILRDIVYLSSLLEVVPSNTTNPALALSRPMPRIPCVFSALQASYFTFFSAFSSRNFCG